MARFITIQNYLAAKFPNLVCGVEYRKRGNQAGYVWLEDRPKWTREVPGFPARFVVYPPDLSRESLLEWAVAIELLLDSSGWSWLVPEADCLAALRSVSQYVAWQEGVEACHLDGLGCADAVLVFVRWLRSKVSPLGSRDGLKTIYYLGGTTYRVEGHGPVVVTDREHAVLQAFLESGTGALTTPELSRLSLYDDRQVRRVLTRLVEKYDGVFKLAIKFPGKPHQGGYRARVVSEKPGT